MLKVMQTLNHIYQPKYTRGQQVSGFFFLLNDLSRNSASNSIRLFFRFFGVCILSVSELKHCKAWYQQCVDSQPPMLPAYMV